MWNGYMVKMLLVLCVLGAFPWFVDFVDGTPNNFTAFAFCFCASVWCSFVVHFWRRRAGSQALKWGGNHVEDILEPCRPEFRGNRRINPITEKPELYFSDG